MWSHSDRVCRPAAWHHIQWQSIIQWGKKPSRGLGVLLSFPRQTRGMFTVKPDPLIGCRPSGLSAWLHLTRSPSYYAPYKYKRFSSIQPHAAALRCQDIRCRVDSKMFKVIFLPSLFTVCSCCRENGTKRSTDDTFRCIEQIHAHSDISIMYSSHGEDWLSLAQHMS